MWSISDMKMHGILNFQNSGKNISKLNWDVMLISFNWVHTSK